MINALDGYNKQLHEFRPISTIFFSKNPNPTGDKQQQEIRGNLAGYFDMSRVKTK